MIKAAFHVSGTAAEHTRLARRVGLPEPVPPPKNGSNSCWVLPSIWIAPTQRTCVTHPRQVPRFVTFTPVITVIWPGCTYRECGGQALRYAGFEMGKPCRSIYTNTVRELNANQLHDWFVDYGRPFGWSAVVSLDELQANANNGAVSIIVAKRKESNQPGHITAVIPEHETFFAARDASGSVRRPVESQAGRKNHRRVVQTKTWWTASRFQSFGLWTHR